MVTVKGKRETFATADFAKASELYMQWNAGFLADKGGFDDQPVTANHGIRLMHTAAKWSEREINERVRQDQEMAASRARVQGKR